ncbi:MAG: hypothetical protein KAR25_07685 [Methanosarcinales archaeon]|nr:hypothetical protein [Methanosarcinales archaeon]
MQTKTASTNTSASTAKWSASISPLVGDNDETSALRERIRQLEEALQCKTIREARKNAGVVQEVAQRGA